MKLYNTLSRTVEELKPHGGKKIKLYTCGLTVYNQPHIGNWVGYIYWDVLVRTLRQSGYEVSHTQNYTDVGHLVSDDDHGEDKMEKGAKREGLTAWDVAAKYIRVAEHEAYDLLGLLRPTNLARATDYIPQQIAFVEALEELGYTYEIPGEGVYFDTSKVKDYGKLARLDIDGLQAGARVAVDGKRNITDFALWKFSPTDQKRDMEWESPWGKGFPGWHLECSVIARETLGDQIDIHTGGIDHIPVHHTNEIAQTEALTGKQFAQIWLHNNHLKVDGRKMSKSLGNIYTLQDILDRGYDIDAFKLMILSKHYQTEGNFTWENLDAAQNVLKELRAFADLRFQLVYLSEPADDILRETKAAIITALENDLDTRAALAELGKLAKKWLSVMSASASQLTSFVQFIDNTFGLNLSLSVNLSDNPHERDKLLGIMASRDEAKLAKNWTESDRLRGELKQQGIGLRDTPNGSIWYRL